MPKKISIPDMLNVLKSRVDVSRRLMEDEKSKTWDECRKFYNGDHWPKALKGKIFTLNLIWSTIRTKLSQSYYKNPKFTLKALHPDFEGPLQMLNESVMNYWAEKSLLKQVARQCIQGAFTDLAIITWGCDTKFKGNTEKSIPDKESFYFKRIMPEHFFPDHSSGEQIFEKLPGFGIKELMRKEEVARRYNVKLDEVKATTSTIDFGEEQRYYQSLGYDQLPEVVKDEFSRVIVTKYYDNDRQQIFIHCEGYDDFLDISNYTDEPPIAVLKYDEKPQGFYSIPELFHLIDAQKIYELAMSMLTEHMRRSARKYQVKRGTLDQAAKDALENPATGVLVELDGTTKIDPIELASADSSIYNNVGMIEATFNQIASMATSQRGGDAQKLTATAESIIDKFNMNRSSDRISLIIDFICKVGTGFLNTLQANLTLPQVMQIAGQEGAQQWIQYIPTLDLRGNFECKVLVGDTSPKDDALERAQWIECLSVLQANPLIMQSPLLIEETLGRFNVDSPRLKAEIVKLGQMAMQAQLIGAMGGPGGVSSKTGNVAGGQNRL